MSGRMLDLEEIQAILEERARELSRPAAEAEDDGDVVEMAIVETGGERYAIDVFYLREVRATPSISAFPSLPSVWAGLMNLRGALHPVLDLGAYLGSVRRDDDERFEVMVVQGGRIGMGLLVDRVVEVRRVRKADVGPPVRGGAGIVSGVTPDLVSVIDMEMLLGDPDLVVKDGAT
jgi:purine-binding chemotaxis protein CheW